MEDRRQPEVQDLVDPKTDEEMCFCSSYIFRQKTTLHFAERKAKLFDNWIMHYLKL